MGEEEGERDASPSRAPPRDSFTKGRPLPPNVGDKMLSMENLSRPWWCKL